MNNITNDKQSLTIYSNKTDRELLIENVQNWVILDQQLRTVNDKTRQIREMKTKLTNDICDYMKVNNVKTNIGINNGELRIYEKKDYKPLTFTYVEKCLSSIIKDKNQIDFIMKYLKDNREINVSQDIKRISSKI